MKRLMLLAIFLFISCQSSNNSVAGWQKVFQNEADGSVKFGDKSRLIDAVRLGYPVRVGWGGNRVEHVAEAEFLTIFQGEVFAQIKTIVGQAPRIDGDSIKIRFRTENQWTKIAGTNGYSTAFMTDYHKDSVVGGGTDRYAATTWYVLFPNHDLDTEARPLWRKEAPNWKKWNKDNSTP